MFNLINPEHEKVFFEARNTILEEKHFNNLSKKNLLDEIADQYNHKDKGENFYDPFDSVVCEGKLKIDMLYYQQLMENLDPQFVPHVESLLVDICKNVKDIYEFINIKPEIYGRNINFNLFNESIGEINKQLSKTIFESLDAMFYRLTPQQRVDKYKEKSEDTIKFLINEGSDPNSAIVFGIKTTIMENLLTKISFPFTCWTRVKYLSESQDYGLVFDQEQLNEIIDAFETKIKKMAKIVATCV